VPVINRDAECCSSDTGGTHPSRLCNYEFLHDSTTKYHLSKIAKLQIFSEKSGYTLYPYLRSKKTLTHSRYTAHWALFVVTKCSMHYKTLCVDWHSLNLTATFNCCSDEPSHKEAELSFRYSQMRTWEIFYFLFVLYTSTRPYVLCVCATEAIHHAWYQSI